MRMSRSSRRPGSGVEVHRANVAAVGGGKLAIGYLQVGRPELGICSYGRRLAAEGRRRPDVTVIEQNVVLTGDPATDGGHLRRAAAELENVDLVHLQVSVWGEHTWGAHPLALRNLRAFHEHCQVPFVVTLHDLVALKALGCDTLPGALARVASDVAK